MDEGRGERPCDGRRQMADGRLVYEREEVEACYPRREIKLHFAKQPESDS